MGGDQASCVEVLRAVDYLLDQPQFHQPAAAQNGDSVGQFGGEGDVVPMPVYATNMDFEFEFAAVIGRGGSNIQRADAASHIYGYMLYNDFSAREIQQRAMSVGLGPAKGKDFDTGNVIGPCIVTADEIADPEALTMIARVNGVEKVRTSSGGGQHSIAATIAYISRDATLHPGDLIGLGTVGDGCGYESLTFLDDGDVVELEVEGIGVLRNRLVGQGG